MAEKDQTLVKRTLSGDGHAFGDLVERYTRLVRGVIWETVRRPDEVEDLVQEAFTKAYEQLPNLRHQARFASWLWSIAANAALSHQYRKKREEEAGAANAEQQLSLSLYLRRPDEVAEQHEAASLVWEALDRLEPESRRLVVLYYFEGCGYQEIARFLGLSVAAVRWRLFRTRDWLRGELLGKLGAEIQVPAHSQQRMREKVMAALPVGLFLAPPPRQWLERWAQWRYWALGTAAGLGIGGLVYQFVQAPANQPSRETLRLEQEAHLHSEPSIEWDPPKPRAGQRVRIRVEDLEVKAGDQAELHYLTDPTNLTTDQIVALRPEGGIWGGDLEIPEGASAVFFYTAPRCEGPQRLNYAAQLTTQKQLRRYTNFLVVHDEKGNPSRGAFHARAMLALRQGQPAEEVLAWVDWELAIYPDHFGAHLARWQNLLKAGQRTPEAWYRVRAEQQALVDKYPDRTEALQWIARFTESWHDSLTFQTRGMQRKIHLEQAHTSTDNKDISNGEATAGLPWLHLKSDRDPAQRQSQLLRAMELAPGFALRDTVGKEVRLADFRGKVLLLYYDSFAYHAEPAQAAEAIYQLRGVEKWIGRLQQRGVEVLHVCRFPGRGRSPFRLALDDDGVADKYQIHLAGVSFLLIDRDGRLCLHEAYRFGEEGKMQRKQLVAKIEGINKIPHPNSN